MTDLKKLRELAEGAIVDAAIINANGEVMHEAQYRFEAAASPEVVIGLIDEIERLRSFMGHDLLWSYDCICCTSNHLKNKKMLGEE